MPDRDDIVLRRRGPQQPVDVGTVRQLLFDDFFLSMAPEERPDEIARGIRFSLGPATKHGAPIVRADVPWETEVTSCTVLHDGGRYRMWYRAIGPDRPRPRTAYAESEDGISFRKPIVGRIEVAGSRENNVVFPGDVCSVFIDPVAPADERYKMVYLHWQPERDALGVFENTLGALRGACSPDGIAWRQYLPNLVTYYPDTQNVATWDPTLERYVAYVRAFARFGGIEAGALRVTPQLRGRAIARTESEDFLRWTAPEIVLAPDIIDGMGADIYNSAYSRHPENPNAHYMFPSRYRHGEGDMETTVAVSRDNRTWVRPCRDRLFPPSDASSFDPFVNHVTPGIVPVDRDTWALYYFALNRPHKGAPPMDVPGERLRSISRITVPRDRVVGIEGAADGGLFATRPIAFSGDRLVVNAEPTGRDPELRVQLVTVDGDPVPGYTFADWRPIASDGLDLAVAWDAGGRVGPAVPRDAVRMVVALRSMRLYAFQFLGD